MRMPARNVPLTVALDARLIGGTSTGDSTYWTGLVHGLSKLDSDVRYLLYSNASRPANVPQSDRLRWIQLAGSPRIWSLVKFPLAARRAKASITHVQYNLSPLIRKGGVTTIHDVSFFIEPKWFQARDRELLQRFVPSSAKRAKAVITVSETSKREISFWIPEAKLKTIAIANAAAIDRQRLPRHEAREIIEARFGLSGPYALTVGTRWPRKNMKLAIEAMESLPSTLAQKLLITGKSGWGEEIAGPRTQFTDYVDEATMNALFSAADLYLAPSLHEGFGIPILEAFRCGAPVISSAGGALPEVVGSAGRIVTSWKAEDWALEIGALLSDSGKLETMQLAGFEREKSFTWEASAMRHEAVYREVSS